MERLTAFRAAMQRHHLEPVLPRFHAETATTQTAEASVYVDQLLACSSPPTAIIAAGDMVALGTLQALQQRGLRVPEDLSLVAYDDLFAPLVIEPFLTVIEQPSYEMGKFAATLLLKRIAGQGPDGPQEVILPTRLIIRQSSSSPRP